MERMWETKRRLTVAGVALFHLGGRADEGVGARAELNYQRCTVL